MNSHCIRTETVRRRFFVGRHICRALCLAAAIGVCAAAPLFAAHASPPPPAQKAAPDTAPAYPTPFKTEFEAGLETEPTAPLPQTAGAASDPLANAPQTHPADDPAGTSARPKRISKKYADSASVFETPDYTTAEWRNIDDGFDWMSLAVPLRNARTGELVIVRIDPDLYDITVLTASKDGEKSRSLRGWAETHSLLAAVNAGMYKPDGVTHTGYLRSGNTLNNGHFAKNLGAFFLGVPDTADLPRATVYDRGAPDKSDEWKEILPHYEFAVQNFRMLSADRRIQWDADGPEHAISAVGQDESGNILFFHCSAPMTCARFAELLLTLPPDIRQVMYVEGGSQAGLYLDTGHERHVWAGKHPAGLLPRGGVNAPLPNIIGVSHRK